MFLTIQKTPMLYLQHNDMGGDVIMPVTSNLRINTHLIAECSIYTIKEACTRKNLEGNPIHVPEGTHVIHLVMNYTHSTSSVHNALEKPYTLNHRYYYKLVFFPGSDEAFIRIKQILDNMSVE